MKLRHGIFDSTMLHGFCLFGSALLAFWLANSSPSGVYHVITSYGFHGITLIELVNDFLMTFYFLLISIEVREELRFGALSSVKKATLPVAAAFGGMIVPFVMYIVLNPHGPDRAGAGVPIATDVAFALAVLSILSRIVPAALVSFLSAFAIADDIGAVLVIGAFYTSALNPFYLIYIGLGLLLMYRSRSLPKFLWLTFSVAAAMLWWGLLKFGLNPTLCGVIFAFFLPVRALKHVKAHIIKPITFLILPLFAFLNAGVEIGGAEGQLAVATGVAIALIFGKPIGVFLGARLAVFCRLGELPSGTNWKDLFGASLLGGIGFTMSLFIAQLSFPERPLENAAKIGILFGSVCSAFLGILWFLMIYVFHKRHDRQVYRPN